MGNADFLVKDPIDADLIPLFNAGEGSGTLYELGFANAALAINNSRKLDKLAAQIAAIEKALNITPAPDPSEPAVAAPKPLPSLRLSPAPTATGTAAPAVSPAATATSTPAA